MPERLGPDSPIIENQVGAEPFRCALGMSNYTLNLYSSSDRFMPYFMGEGVGYLPWIPGWNVIGSPKASEYSIVYSPRKNTQVEYKENEKRLYVSGCDEDFQDGQALAYMAFWLLEAQRQADGIVAAHASSVSYEDKGVLILGERGDGKTSVCLGLGRKHGYKLIANDLAMLGYNQQNDQVEVHDGTKIFGLRLSAIRGRFDELLCLYKDATKESWTTKVFVTPSEVGIETDVTVKPVRSVFMVHIDSTGTDKFSAHQMDDLWIRNYLYENFSRYIRGTAIIAFGSQSREPLGYLPSLDQQQFHDKRLQLIEYLIKKIKIINISGGNLEQIMDYIHDTQNTEQGISSL